MIIISSKEFNANTLLYLDKVDKGEEVLIQRGKNRAYKILPITEKDRLVKDEDAILAEEPTKEVKEEQIEKVDKTEHTITGTLDQIKNTIAKFFEPDLDDEL